MFFGFLKTKPKYPAAERRREPRYPAEDEFMLEIKQTQSHYMGASRDISLHGIRFATTYKPKLKQEILLNLRFPQSFPGPKNLLVRAKVARVYKPRGTERYRIGCSLQHENDAGKETMRQFIHWLENRPGK